MEIRRGLDALPRDGTRSVVTIGFFDGVHRGHRGVLARTVEAARDRDARSAAITFDRHPREVLTPGSEPRLLTTTERKAQLIAESGIDTLVVLEFTPEFSGWPAEAFVERVLVEGLSAVHIAVGGNFTFGHRALGNVAMLRAL
ncbi:MAG: bifunctional riboflavin kinase/FAD synthetase, partial [Actinomycetota bacterium]